MNRIERLLKTAGDAVAILESDRKRRFRNPCRASLQRTIRDQARVPLRRALGANISKLDFRVVDDLLSILEALNTGTRGKKEEFTQRIELALKLTEMSVGKQKGIDPEHLLWIFHKHYNGIGPTIQIEEQRRNDSYGGML